MSQHIRFWSHRIDSDEPAQYRQSRPCSHVQSLDWCRHLVKLASCICTLCGGGMFTQTTYIYSECSDKPAHRRIIANTFSVCALKVWIEVNGARHLAPLVSCACTLFGGGMFTQATSECSDKPAHPPNIARAFLVCALNAQSMD